MNTNQGPESARPKARSEQGSIHQVDDTLYEEFQDTDDYGDDNDDDSNNNIATLF